MLLFAGSAVCAGQTRSRRVSLPTGVVNINQASATTLTVLPRIGSRVADRILLYRKQHGPFKSTTEIMNVRGIGEKSFQTLKPYVKLTGPTTLKAAK